MSELQDAITRIQSNIDTYHALPHPAPLERLWEIRRDIVCDLGGVTRFVKASYGKKVLSYARRKWQIAREIVAALEADKKLVGVKPRPMNMLEVQTEALDHVLQSRKEQIDAEGEWEEIESIKAAFTHLESTGAGRASSRTWRKSARHPPWAGSPSRYYRKT